MLASSSRLSAIHAVAILMLSIPNRTLPHVVPIAWHFLATLYAWKALLSPRGPPLVPASPVDPSLPKEGHLQTADGGFMISRPMEPRGLSLCDREGFEALFTWLYRQD